MQIMAFTHLTRGNTFLQIMLKYNTCLYFYSNKACVVIVIIKNINRDWVRLSWIGTGWMITARKKVKTVESEIAEIITVRYRIQIEIKFRYDNVILKIDFFNMVHYPCYFPIFLLTWYLYIVLILILLVMFILISTPSVP